MSIKSLAGSFHPHAIEVQDFDYYSLVIDLRSRAAFEDDHIPGAVHVELPAPPASSTQQQPEGVAPAALRTEEQAHAPMWPALEALVAGVRLDQAILVYCGRGGLDSTPVARALGWRGWTADVLPGGWINYRRWVQAGVDVLPRMVSWRVVVSTLGSQVGRVLDALQQAGHQVLDLEALASCRRFAVSAASSRQPAQAWFESLLLRELRGFDPRRPVWVGDVGATMGKIALPGALWHAMAIAPAAQVDVPLKARVDAWMADEPLCGDLAAVIHQVAAIDPAPPDALLSRWREQAAGAQAEPVLASMLVDHLDGAYARDRASRCQRQHALAPLAVTSLEAAQLLAAAQSMAAHASAPPPAT